MSPGKYAGRCTVCGTSGSFLYDAANRSIRENFKCASCRASLRYREQARLIVKHFARSGAACLAELVLETEFQTLAIFEPGLIGPFRKYLKKLTGYRSSFFSTDAAPGESRNGIEYQDLMNLTYEDDSFDLMLSSDIFEHVRKPFPGFREVNRVLKPGGFHIFSIPLQHPMRAETVFRVDTSGPVDVHVLPTHYHGAPSGNRSLVYTDFGADMVDRMAEDGIALEIEFAPGDESPSFVAERMLSFYWRKVPLTVPGPVGSVAKFG